MRLCPVSLQIDDIKDRLVSGSESSRAMREIRTRDPGFDMNNFVRSVKVRLECFDVNIFVWSVKARL